PENLAAFVLANAAGRLVIDLEGTKLRITASAAGSSEKATIDKTNFSHSIKSGFRADIRYFPKRPGMFQAKGVNGKVAWAWGA
nr:hypothetical protein [Sphingomonas sp.]